jgi:N-terminal domain of BNR-repeat neuraminidase
MKKIYLLFLSLCFITASQAQLTGTKNIPGDYATLALAITDLNVQGVGAGGVILNVLAGNPQTSPSALGTTGGGYVIGGTGSLVLTTTSAANPVTIQGNANTITAPTGASPAGHVAGQLNDAIIKLVGADWITITGFTLLENAGNTVTAAGTNTMTEFGIALFYASATDGAQNNTIQNNTISLSRLYQNSFGIYSNVRHTTISMTASAEVATSAAGSNSFNKVYTNAINNVNYGIVFVGAVTTLAAIDNGNDIGGSSAATGNTLTNWGVLGTAISGYISVTGANSGIVMHQQINDNISYNTITSFSGAASGVMVAITLNGITKTYAATPTGTITSNITNNTITVTSAPTTGFCQAISSTGLAALATSTLNINNNNIINCAITGAAATTGAIVGITNSSVFGTLNINNNVISGSTRTGTTGQVQGISNSGAIVNAININSNQFGTAAADYVNITTASSGAVFAINSSAAAATCNVTVQNNDVRKIFHVVAGTSSHTYISVAGTPITNNISNNTFTNLILNTTGSVTFIAQSYTASATGTKVVNGNTIITGFSKTSAGGTVTFVVDNGSSVAGAVSTYQNNSITNGTLTGATAFIGISCTDGGASPTKNINNNTINNWTTGAGALTGINVTYLSGAGNIISTNTITNLNGQSSIAGINIGNSAATATSVAVATNIINNLNSTGTGGSVTGIACANTSTGINISSNQINTLSSTGAATVSGVSISGSTATAVFKNNIYNLSNSNASPTVSGITVSAGTLTNAYNNFVSDLRTPNANAAVPIYGINVSGGTGVGLYYNTIALGKAATLTSGGAQFGVTGIGYSSTTNTTLRNNIVWIDATPVGTGAIAAVRRSAAGVAGTAPSSTNFNSNNNIYYVLTATGISPVVANLNKYLYLEGNVTTTATNGYGVEIGQVDNVTLNLKNDAGFNTACGLYKTFMGSREGGTFTEDNLTASGGPAFTFVPSGASFADNSGQVIATPAITDDYNAVARTATPDMGALEFAGTAIDATPPLITYTAIPNLTCTTAPVLLATITDASGVNVSAGLAPRLYYRKGGVTVESNVFLNYPTENTSAFDGWKYVEATGTAPNFSFAVDYSLLTSPMALGDSLTYFVIAQDLAASPNVGKNTITFPAGFCPTSVVIPATGAAPATASLGYRIVSLSATKTDANAATAVNTGTTNATFVYTTINGNAACLSTVSQVDFTVSGTTPAADIAAAKCYYTTTPTFSTTTPFGGTFLTPAAGNISFTGTQNLAVGANYFWLVYDVACAATPANTINGEVTGITVNSTLIVPTGTATVQNAIAASSSFTTVADGDWSNPATWGSCGVPVIACGSTATININNAVTVTTAGNLAPNVTIGATGSLTVSSGDLTLGCTSAAGATGNSNKLLTVNGTLTVSGGTINLNGAATFATASIFNMSSGVINADPNDGTAAGSSTASGGFIINTPTLNLTGGNINLLDPMYTATAGTGQTVLSYSHASLDAATGATIFTFGGGDDQNPLNVNGFYVECNISTGTLEIGNAVVAGGRFAAQRELTSRQGVTNYITKFKNLTINAGAEVTLTAGSAPCAITGNLINIGVITNAGATTASGLFFADAQFSGGVVLLPITSGQSISGSGFFKKSTADADPTAQTGNIIGSLSVYHLITSPGVTLNMPITVTNNLRLLKGKVNTTSTNFLALGNGIALPGNPVTLTATTGTIDGFSFGPLTAAAYDGGHVVGTFNRWVTATTTTGQQGLMPVGSDTARVAQILFTTAPTAAGYLTASWTDGGGSSAVSPTLNQVGVTPSTISLSSVAKWDIENLGTLTGGTYTASLNNKRTTSVSDYVNTVLLKRATGATGSAWEDDGLGAPIGTYVATTGSNSSPVIGRSGLTTFSSFAIGGGSSILPVSIEFFKGAKIAGANYLDWKVSCTNAPSVELILERSADGRNFRALNNQNATATRCLQGFDYTDVNPLAGANYYRLKVTEPSGKFSYSTIVVLLNKEKGFELISLAPNPAIGKATLTLTSAKAGKIEIVIRDITGKNVSGKSLTVIAGNNPIDMNFATLGAGTYSITAINAEGEIKTIRFVKY